MLFNVLKVFRCVVIMLVLLCEIGFVWELVSLCDWVVFSVFCVRGSSVFRVRFCGRLMVFYICIVLFSIDSRKFVVKLVVL